MLQRLHRTLGSFPSMGTATSGISRSTLRPMRFPAPVSLGTIKPKLACSVDSEMAPLAMSLEDACKTIDKLLKSDPDQKKDPSPQIQKLVDELRYSFGCPAGVLKAFGNARQLPKRVYTLDELRMNNISPEMLLSPKDYSLNCTRNVAQAAAAAGFVAFAYLDLDDDDTRTHDVFSLYRTTPQTTTANGLTEAAAAGLVAFAYLDLGDENAISLLFSLYMISLSPTPRNVSQAAAAAGFVAFAYLNHLDAQQVLATMFGITFLFVVDQSFEA
eukprot:gene17091-23387_t